MKRSTPQRGFMKAIVTIALALVVLKFAFHIDPLHALSDPRIEPYYTKSYDWVMDIWMRYLLPALQWCWDKLQIGWELLKEFWHKAAGAIVGGYEKGKVYKE